MSAEAESEPPSEAFPPAKKADTSLNDSKSKVISYINQRINNLRRHYHEFLSEFTYLQSGGILNEYESWRCSMPQDLMHALCSGHLDADDLNKIGSFMSGQLPMHEIFPVAIDSTQGDDVDEESDEDFDVSYIFLSQFAIFSNFGISKMHMIAVLESNRRISHSCVSSKGDGHPHTRYGVQTPGVMVSRFSSVNGR